MHFKNMHFNQDEKCWLYLPIDMNTNRQPSKRKYVRVELIIFLIYKIKNFQVTDSTRWSHR